MLLSLTLLSLLEHMGIVLLTGQLLPVGVPTQRTLINRRRTHSLSGVSCSDTLGLFNITLQELQFWNPSLNPDCDTGLVVGTLYCVGDGPPPPGPPIVPIPPNVATGTITS